jgi:hypothetical protein
MEKIPNWMSILESLRIEAKKEEMKIKEELLKEFITKRLKRSKRE